jgi:Xaa-Pro aminopeptidase
MHDDRRNRLASLLGDDVDAVLVSKIVNVRYLTGFTGSNAALLLGRDGALLATDGRYAEQAAAECPDLPVLVTGALAADLVAEAARRGWRRLGVETHVLTVDAYDALRTDQVELLDAAHPVERLRVAKDDAEIDALRAACAATDAVFARVLDALRPGVTERDIGWELQRLMHEVGAEGPAFPSIVGFGPNSAIPHHSPGDRALAPGDLVKLDFGAKVDGYHSDMTRTVVCGKPADWQRDLHAQVAVVQEKCRAATTVGADPAGLEQLARDLITADGHEFVHGLGHGVGLEIHEQPFLVPGTSAARLDDRVPVTVEPGIYLPGRGGVRIEDVVLVREGGTESLTTSPRELLEI